VDFNQIKGPCVFALGLEDETRSLEQGATEGLLQDVVTYCDSHP